MKWWQGVLLMLGAVLIFCACIYTLYKEANSPVQKHLMEIRRQHEKLKGGQL